MRRRQDLSARSTVIPEPQLGVDEIGLPKKMLQTIFRKPVIRRLVKLGYTPLQAQDEIDKDSAIARRSLELETEVRPVMVNRAPSLHKFGMMAFKNVSYTVSTAFTTCVLLFSQRILQEDAFSTGWQRIVATLLGTAIALAVVLPTVERDRRSTSVGSN